MVCDKSLYCLKYGPCASHSTRKQIWEENSRLRESFRNLNRADHYWSFQTVPHLLHGSIPIETPASTCTSVTHTKKLDTSNKQKDACTETTPPILKKPPKPSPPPLVSSTSAQTINPSPLTHSSSSPALLRRSASASQPNLTLIPFQPRVNVQPAPIRPSRTTRQNLLPPKTVPFAPYGCNNQSTSGELAVKKTHNVRANRESVHPAALAALQRRKETLCKLLHSEENQLRDNLKRNTCQKPVNHSSLWATEYSRNFKEKRSPISSSLRRVHSQANFNI